MVQVPPWCALVGYGLASACSLCWCVRDAATALVQSGADYLTPDPLNKGAHGVELDQLQHTAQLIGSHMLHSELCCFVLFNFMTSVYLLSALITKALFLGSLTVAEASKLTERVLKFIGLKVVFLGAVVVPNKFEYLAWIGWFSVVGFLKVFVGLCRDRFESLMSSPSASVAAHVRTLALLSMLLLTDVCWILIFLSMAAELQFSQLLLWLFDTAVIVVEGVQALVKYGVHMFDRMRTAQAERAQQAQQAKHGQHVYTRPGPVEGWEAKGAVLYHVELVSDLLLHSMTLGHYLHIFWMHGFALQLLDAILFLDLRSLVAALFGRIRGYQRYCAATHNLKHLFPDATPAQLMQRCDECAICREHMQAAKVLPCEHLFHLSCLRAWLQQSGSDNFTCPICRAPLVGARTKPQPPAGVAASHGQWPPSNPHTDTSQHSGPSAHFMERLLSRRWLPAVMQLGAGGLDADFSALLESDAALSQAAQTSSSSLERPICRFSGLEPSGSTAGTAAGGTGEEVTSRPSSGWASTSGRGDNVQQQKQQQQQKPRHKQKGGVSTRGSDSGPGASGRPGQQENEVSAETAAKVAAIREVLPAALDHVIAAELARANGSVDEALIRVMACM